MPNIVIEELGMKYFNLERKVQKIEKYFTFYSQNMFCRKNCKIYQDVFTAGDEFVLRRIGGGGYDATSYGTKNKWNYTPIINFGGNESDGNGAEVNIPEGFDLLWIRVLNDRFTDVSIYFLDGVQEKIGRFYTGNRHLNAISPNGTSADGGYATHLWMPIPVKRNGKVAMISKANTSSGFWISGIAFGLNIWKIAYNSAGAYSLNLNGGKGVIAHNLWNRDQLAYIAVNTVGELYVPVIPSKNNKMLYWVSHNDSWNDNCCTKVRVNDVEVDSFYDGYDNPIARHHNGKIYSRYFATIVPKEIIPRDATFIKVEIDMSKQVTNGFYFREFGTHDELTFDSIEI